MNAEDRTIASGDENVAELREKLETLESRLLAYEVDARRHTAELIRRREAVPPRPDTQLFQLLAEMTLAINTMQATKFWRLRNAWFLLKHRLGLSKAGPALAYDFVDRIEAIKMVGPTPYEKWIARTQPRESDLALMRRTIAHFPATPMFSFIVPVYETPESYLRAMIESVLSQIYPYWELCLVDDASPSPYIGAVLQEYATAEPRIKVHRRESNGHIVRASNDALAMASGEFVALLDHDDLLTPDALYEVALALLEHSDADLLYSDEDKIDDEGRRFGPFFKPDWCPDSFLTRMYTSHLGVYRRSLVSDLGGFRAGFDGSQDYDLVLRVTERTDRIVHIPRVLYHWRVHSGSVASGAQAKPYAYDAALRALNEAMERRGEGGRVEHLGDALGHYVVRYAIRSHEKVSIIIPTRDHGDDVDRCLTSIFERSTYPDFEVLVLDNGSREPATRQIFENWMRREPDRLRIIRHDVPFNFSEINNYAASHATGTHLLFLNNDTEVVAEDWIEAMVEQAQRESIGAVGAKLLYEDGRIQHAGVVLGIGGIAGHAFRFFEADAQVHYNYLQTVNNFSAVTAACMMMRRSVFEEVGGFDERFAVAYNDVDLCLRIGRAGYRIVYLPHVVLFHYESKSRGYDVSEEQVARDQRERELMQRVWGIAGLRDPCYNPNLTLEREDFSIAP